MSEASPLLICAIRRSGHEMGDGIPEVGARRFDVVLLPASPRAFPKIECIDQDVRQLGLETPAPMSRRVFETLSPPSPFFARNSRIVS